MAFKEGTPQRGGGVNSCKLQVLLPWYWKAQRGHAPSLVALRLRKRRRCRHVCPAYLTGAGDDQCVRIDSLADRLSLCQCSPSKMITGKFLKVGTWLLDTMSTSEIPCSTHLAQNVRFLSGSPTTKACDELWGVCPSKRRMCQESTSDHSATRSFF